MGTHQIRIIASDQQSDLHNSEAVFCLSILPEQSPRFAPLDLPTPIVCLTGESLSVKLPSETLCGRFPLLYSLSAPPFSALRHIVRLHGELLEFCAAGAHDEGEFSLQLEVSCGRYTHKYEATEVIVKVPQQSSLILNEYLDG